MEIKIRKESDIHMTAALDIGTPLTYPDHNGEMVCGVVRNLFTYKDALWVILDIDDGVRTVKLI